MNISKRIASCVGCALVAFLATACGGRGAADSAEGSASLGGGLGSAAPPIAADPPGSVRVNNTLYVPLTGDLQPSSFAGIPIAQQTDEQLAESLRPVMMQADSESGTHYFIGANPATDVVQAARHSHLGTFATPSSLGFGTDANSGLRPQWFFDPSNSGQPIEADDSSADNTNTFPFNAIDFVKAFGGSVFCTAENVDQNTILTAAHCVNKGGTWTSNPVNFTPGALGSGGSVTSSPFGTFPNTQGSWCYNITVPSAWTSGSCPKPPGQVGETDGCEQFDFATVDFRPCGNATIQNWFGLAINEANLPSVHLDGYPGFYTFSGSPPDPVAGTQFPGCGANTNPTGAFPFLCGASGPAVTENSVTIESGSNVGSPGFSGGPWWATNPPGLSGTLVMGIDSGEAAFARFSTCGFNTCFRNFGRWIESTAWSFIQAHTEL